jgi:hypothetical protein
MSKQLECNEDLVLDLLKFSKFGAMGQIFVLEAIRHYAEQVASGEDVNAPGPKDLWQAIGADVKERCDAFYSRHDRADETAKDGDE